MECQGRWATQEEIAVSLIVSVPEERLTKLLEGLVVMRELESQVFDDGIAAYRLTLFGSRWTAMGILA